MGERKRVTGNMSIDDQAHAEIPKVLTQVTVRDARNLPQSAPVTFRGLFYVQHSDSQSSMREVRRPPRWPQPNQGTDPQFVLNGGKSITPGRHMTPVFL